MRNGKHFRPTVFLLLAFTFAVNGQAQDKKEKETKLTPESRAAIVRFIQWESVKAVRDLPPGKKGFTIKAGEPISDKKLQELRQLIANNGITVVAGKTAMITNLEFQGEKIVVELNGGGGKKTRWRDRIQVSVGDGRSRRPTTTTSGDPQEQQKSQPGDGATIILDFGRSLPDMTPDELKAHLAVFLDFSKQRSPAVQYIDTVPPEFQKPIREGYVVNGMDEEMVENVFKGKPDKSPLTERRDDDNLLVTTWMYGTPNSTMIFIEFDAITEKVVRIRRTPDTTKCRESSRPDAPEVKCN